VALMDRPYTPAGKAARYAYWALCAAILMFLTAPIAAIVPLSFNSGSLLSYPLAGLSTRWYQELISSPYWMAAFRNSLIVALATTAVATPLGTLAALGLNRLSPRYRPLVMGLLIAPMVAPVIVLATGAYFLYAPLRLTDSYASLILAHTTLATPYVVLAVNASLQGFDTGLLRAASSLGAPPRFAFIKVLLPMIGPGVAAGAIFAFMTSFDEIVMAIFLAGPEQRTLPLQMFDGVREQISPTITAAASVLILTSVLLLGAVELLRRRGARLTATAA
jgi:putative spermidine/putrescine transport system permease protein